MNRQFKELALQAGYPDYMTYGQDLVLERFAESIVRQCAEVGLDSVEDGDDLDAIMRRVHNNILKHFSVDTQTE